MSEPLDIVEVLRRPLETISQCRRMRYVTADVAEIAVAEIARLREERRRREALWLACADETRLVYGGVFTLQPGPEGDG